MDSVLVVAISDSSKLPAIPGHFFYKFKRGIKATGHTWAILCNVSCTTHNMCPHISSLNMTTTNGRGSKKHPFLMVSPRDSSYFSWMKYVFKKRHTMYDVLDKLLRTVHIKDTQMIIPFHFRNNVLKKSLFKVDERV